MCRFRIRELSLIFYTIIPRTSRGCAGCVSANSRRYCAVASAWFFDVNMTERHLTDYYISFQIGYIFDPLGAYETTVSRTGKRHDVSAAFLTAVEDDPYMLPHKKTIVAEQVSEFVQQACALLTNAYN